MKIGKLVALVVAMAASGAAMADGNGIWLVCKSGSTLWNVRSVLMERTLQTEAVLQGKARYGRDFSSAIQTKETDTEATAAFQRGAAPCLVTWHNVDAPFEVFWNKLSVGNFIAMYP